MKHLKEVIKKPAYLLSLIFFIIIISISVVFFHGLKIASSKVDFYEQEISKISNSINEINKIVNQGFVKLNSAELFLNNTNKILSTVYFGTADRGECEEAKNFTAFTIQYNDKFYLITAGHCVEMDGEKYENFKFKSNRSKNWVMPELLDYKSDYKNNLDYAIFYSGNPINTGLIPAKPGEDMTPLYILGNLERGLNLVKVYSNTMEGESGSPILNSSCHVIGLIIKSDGTYTPIAVVLDALKKLPIK